MAGRAGAYPTAGVVEIDAIGEGNIQNTAGKPRNSEGIFSGSTSTVTFIGMNVMVNFCVAGCGGS